MKPTVPKVRLIAGTQFYDNVAHDYLYDIGCTALPQTFDTRHLATVSDAGKLAEFAGRLCYRSWEPGLNPNVTKVRTDHLEYMQNVIASGHGSVLEHASFTFLFQNVSRVFTHELVRHRAGVAISQESLRYVRLTELGFRVPAVLEDATDEIVTLVETLEDFQVAMAEKYGLDDPDTDFAKKKEVTSALRRMAPIGLSTTILWTANIRTLRFVIEQRTSPHAEEEIRSVFCAVAHEMLRVNRSLFADMRIAEDGTCTFGKSKV